KLGMWPRRVGGEHELRRIEGDTLHLDLHFVGGRWGDIQVFNLQNTWITVLMESNDTRHGFLLVCCGILPTSSRRPPFFHLGWTTNIIKSAKSTSIVLTCARTSASIAVRSPIISIFSLVRSLPVVVSAAIVLGSGFSMR